ncbi:MAG: hypothetical protein KGV46_02160 [Pasteurella sp.]|nr:hypothetical protein [Pasteurella sp.]
MKFLQKYNSLLIQIFHEEDLCKYDVGYITMEDEHHIVLESFDASGFKDGYIVIPKYNINLIQTNSEYLKKMNVLIKENTLENIQNSYLFKGHKINIKDQNNLLRTLLVYAKDNKLHCSIDISDKGHDIAGWIQEVTDEHIFVQYHEESFLIHIDDVENVEIDSLVGRENALVM